MKLQILTVVVVLAGMVTGDTKMVTPYSFPGVVVVGQAPTRAVSYVHHTAAAAMPTFRSSALHYAVPQPVQAVQYAAAPAVRYAPTLYSATYHQPAAATIVRKEIDFDDEDHGYMRPMTYGAVFTRGSFEDDSDDLIASPYGIFKFEDHDDRK